MRSDLNAHSRLQLIRGRMPPGAVKFVLGIVARWALGTGMMDGTIIRGEPGDLTGVATMSGHGEVSRAVETLRRLLRMVEHLGKVPMEQRRRCMVLKQLVVSRLLALLQKILG